MKFELSQAARDDMRITASWMRFYAIILLVASVFSVLGGLSLLGKSSQFFNVTLVVGVLVILAIILSLMAFYLLGYSTQLINISESGNVNQLESGFAKYKTFFVIWGIFTVLSVIVTLYTLFPLFN